MALLFKDPSSNWVFQRGKHIGRTLEEAAKVDPSYLQWMFLNATEDLNNEAYYLLEDVMERNRIEFFPNAKGKAKVPT
jgi:hypothetical protein